jgi:hypothetical protein
LAYKSFSFALLACPESCARLRLQTLVTVMAAWTFIISISDLP